MDSSWSTNDRKTRTWFNLFQILNLKKCITDHAFSGFQSGGLIIQKPSLKACFARPAALLQILHSVFSGASKEILLRM